VGRLKEELEIGNIMDGVATKIIACIQCPQKLRVPANVGKIRVKCPTCLSQWEISTGDQPRSYVRGKGMPTGHSSFQQPSRDPELNRSPYKIIDIAQDTDEWHEWRNQGLGASDAPAIMGENPWKSREQMLREKLTGLRTKPNERMERGKALETEARTRYERLLGVKIRPACLQSTRFDWLRASIDGLALDYSSVVEIKCGERVYELAASKRQVPEYYFGQLQHILAVTGLSRIDFWCYLPRLPARLPDRT